MKSRFLFIFMFLLLFLWLVPQAIAVGTPAGTGITNQAYVDYSDANGNPLTRVFSNTVTTTVSQVPGVDVGENVTLTGANESTVYFDSHIVNTGNGSDLFDFNYTLTSGWTPTSVTLFADVNGDGIYDVGTDIAVTDSDGDGTPDTGSLPADQTYHIILAVGIPVIGIAGNGTTSVVTITATSQFDGAVTDFGDYTTQVSTAVLSITKTALKPDGSPLTPDDTEPGDIIIYALEGHNTGTATAESVVITDAIPANTTYVAGSIRIGPEPGTYATATTQTDGGGDDQADYNVTNPGEITIDWGDSIAGDSGVLYFQVSINPNATNGSSISNIATINYEIGGIAQPATSSNTASFSVTPLPAVAVTPGTTDATGDPGDTITYAITIDNNGNAADVIDVTYTSSEGWTWDLWYDANDDGIAGNDGDFLLTDTDGDGIVDTGSIPQGGSAAILATTTIPAGTVNGTVDTLVVTGTSSIDTSISDTTGSLSTTVTAPVIAITKTVSPIGNQPPNTVLTYTVTVTNNGTGVANTVVITDLIPTFTTYVPESITLDGVGKTDAVDGDGAEFDSGSNAVIAGGAAKSLGPSGSTFILEFQVTID